MWFCVVVLVFVGLANLSISENIARNIKINVLSCNDHPKWFDVLEKNLKIRKVSC